MIGRTIEERRPVPVGPALWVLLALSLAVLAAATANVHPALADYLRHKERVFGPDRVWTYAARPYFGRGPTYSRLTTFFLALCLAGPVWAAAGGVLREPGWGAGGVFAVLLGGLFALLF